MSKKWSRYLIAYLAWIAVMALGFWFWVVSRSALLAVLARIAQGEILRVWRARFVDQVYAIVVGVIWVAVAIVAESYLRQGAERDPGRRDNVLVRSAHALGLVLLFIGGADLILFLFQGPFTLGWLRWLILAAELGAGIALMRWRVGKLKR